MWTHFGNLISDIPLAGAFTLPAPGLRIEVAGRVIARSVTHFAAGPVDEPFALRDSSGALAIAVRDGSAAAALGLGRGAVGSGARPASHLSGAPRRSLHARQEASR